MTYRPLPNQGIENHLFIYNQCVLKVYRWFLFKNLSVVTEKALRESQQRLLQVYAPALESRVIAGREDGYLAPDLLPEKVFCYGLYMQRGVPFWEEIWENLTGEKKLVEARRIGRALAGYHQQAPKVASCFYNQPSVLYEWLADLCGLLESYRKARPVIPVVSDAVLRQAICLPALKEDNKAPFVAVVHGDLNLTNIVVFEKQFQFIDPGYALPLGVGLQHSTEMVFDVGWDLSCLAASFVLYGNERCARAFLEAYTDAAGWSLEVLSRKMFYWDVLFSLMVVVICLKEWEMLSDPENQFALRLRQRNLSLKRYVRYFCGRVLALLDLLEMFPEFIPLMETGLLTARSEVS